MDPAQYEAHLVEQMMQTMGFVLITWLPLQIGAILIVRHPLARIGAGLATLPMLPILITGFQTKTYRDGSLFGIAFMGIYVPVMVYLALFLFAGLAARVAKQKPTEAPKHEAPEAEPTSGNASQRSQLLLMALAVLFGIAALIGIILLIPR